MKKFTWWSVVALVAIAGMLLCEQNAQAQCANARSPGLAGAANNRQGNAQGFGRQGGMLQAMQMVQRAQQVMRIQQQMAQRQQQLRRRQQPVAQSSNNTFASRSQNRQGNFFNNSTASFNAKPKSNPVSRKARRIAKLRAYKEARQKKKEEALAKRKAKRANRNAELEQQQEESE